MFPVLAEMMGYLEHDITWTLRFSDAGEPGAPHPKKKKRNRSAWSARPCKEWPIHINIWAKNDLVGFSWISHDIESFWIIIIQLNHD
jgi:hypothetical protein